MKAKRKRKAKAPAIVTGQDLRICKSELPPHAVGHAVEVQIDSPDGVANSKATKTLRDDPLGRLHARRQINDAQASAGDYTRALFHLRATDGVAAMDFGKPFVDNGSGGAGGTTDRQLRAAKRLELALRILGREGFALVREVLAHRKFIEQIARERGISSKDGIAYLGKRFRECLDTLAEIYGFTVRGANPKAVRDKHAHAAHHANQPELHRALTAATDAVRLKQEAEAAKRGRNPVGGATLTLPEEVA